MADRVDSDEPEPTLEMHAGSARVAIHPAYGGRIGQITLGDRLLLRPRQSTTDGAHGWGQWGSYPLLPWSNRIPGGRFRFEGQTLSVPVNWEDGSALHGLAAERPWKTVAADHTAIDLTIDVDRPPYLVTGHQSFQLAETHLDVTLAIVNNAPSRVPVGLGIHPWFAVDVVRVPADLVWPGDTPLPVGPPRPVTADEDLRVGRIAPPMDRCFTGLTDTWAEVGPVHLSWSGPISQVVVFSGMPEWVCVEPVTMANDGFRLADEGVAGHGVIVLDPGEVASVSYRFGWT